MIPDRPADTTPTARLRLRILTTISLVTVAITAFAGAAQAAPTTPTPTTYDLHATAASLRITVHNGTISTNNGALEIRDSAGITKFRMPLAYRMEYLQFPIDARTVGTTAILTPSKNPARSTPVIDIAGVNALRTVAAKQQNNSKSTPKATPKVDPDAPKTRKQRDDRARSEFNTTLAMGMTISQLVGMIIGAIAGGLIGCIITIFAACTGVVAGAGLGGIIGLVLGGGGTLIYAAVQYFNTINAPFVPPANASAAQG
ncbi:hypothetical protein [Gordonia rhizosphera]|uniref:DUF8020 domain-containing protein n=1 Tax=Gordonia rhizosphera NBRC 16068 TaxID=1108045 RepID=K6W771_9ACTN|nr:hypothetical protein [Gordonia rhizosphera]GAB88072.1 hypothetical protein GORHZ_001_00040 [Gordonia rhizosphera NBRC 16068]